MTEDAQQIQGTTKDLQSTTTETEPITDVDSADNSGLGLPLNRRHMIIGTLSALGLSTMGNGQAQEGGSAYGEVDLEIKTGMVSHENPGASPDGTWNTSEVDRQSVEFSTAFEQPPVVLIGSAGYTSIGLFRAYDITETGFESRWMVYRSKSYSAPDAQWVAVGQS